MGDTLQNALVEHYENSKGLIAEQDLGLEPFNEWIRLIDLLFEQALILNREDWDNITELKECSRTNKIWNTVGEIYKIFNS